jgi:hypothetical protein
MTAMWGAGPVPAERYLDRPVWVDLDVLYGPPPAEAVPWPGGDLRQGLVLTGRVPGILKLWGRAVDGRWVGCRPGLELTADRSARRPFRQGRTARTPDAAAWRGDTGA